MEANTPDQHGQRIVGYDAREMWLGDGDLWPAQRQQYLLRSDVPKPLSTDTMVWPSVFGKPFLEAVASGFELQRPDWTGAVLWDDLERLKAHLDAGWGKSCRPCRLIAVTLAYGHCENDEQRQWDQRLVGITPPSVCDDWTFLGYDIADHSLLSGLMNCGYTPQELKVLPQRWAPRLNEHHLFDDFEQAAEFVAVTDERVQEHAPFFIFGIYSLPLPQPAGTSARAYGLRVE